MTQDNIIFTVATWLIPLTIAIVFHEVAHGLVARHFGDMTASDAGRLTLNPLRHVDPLGTIVIPMMLAVAGAPIFGWAKGVPVVPSRLRNPRWHMVAVAAAGPGSNLVMAMIGTVLLGLAWRFLPNNNDLAVIFALANLANFVLINLLLAVFNMLPMPPFDGSRILGGLLPPPMAARYRSLDRYGLFIMLILLVILPQVAPSLDLFRWLVEPPVRWLLGLTNAVAGAIAGPA